MAIRTVVTRGYGNGTFDGTIALIVVRGYSAGAAVAAAGTRRMRQMKSLIKSRHRRRR